MEAALQKTTGVSQTSVVSLAELFLQVSLSFFFFFFQRQLAILSDVKDCSVYRYVPWCRLRSMEEVGGPGWSIPKTFGNGMLSCGIEL